MEKLYKKSKQLFREKVKKFNKYFKNYKTKIIFCTLLLSGNKEIKRLNKKFRNKNKATDILSFPFYKKEQLKKNLKKIKKFI